MEDRLAEWLLDNRPYTHLQRRIKHFILFCQQLEPGAGYTRLRREVSRATSSLMRGDVGRLWKRDRAFERTIRLYGANDQRTNAWHTKRGEMITASEVYKVFGSEDARREVMMRKLEPAVPSEGTGAIPALLWGTRFEPVAKQIYEERTKCHIIDVSCATHPVHKFLGASPDGLIVPNEDDPKRYGRLVEFKCPMSRAMKDEIPVAYVHQMQMQMECTGIDECEYVEFRFKQVNYTEWERSTQTKGCFGVYDDGRVVYNLTEHPEDCQVIYWILSSIKQDFVPKDPNWLSDHIGQLKSFWDEVVAHRAAGTKPESKPKNAVLDI